MAWHAEMSYDDYRALTWNERIVIHEELSDLIDRAEEEGSARPKEQRR